MLIGGKVRELYAEREWSEASGHNLHFSILFKQHSQRFLSFFLISPHEAKTIPHKTCDHHLRILVLGHHNLTSGTADAKKRCILLNM
jgi:hypothetical protein